MEHKRTRRAPPVSYAELPPKRNRTITAEAQAHMQQRRIESRAACATGTKKDNHDRRCGEALAVDRTSVQETGGHVQKVPRAHRTGLKVPDVRMRGRIVLHSPN